MKTIYFTLIMSIILFIVILKLTNMSYYFSIPSALILGWNIDVIDKHLFKN